MSNGSCDILSVYLDNKNIRVRNRVKDIEIISNGKESYQHDKAKL